MRVGVAGPGIMDVSHLVLDIGQIRRDSLRGRLSVERLVDTRPLPAPCYRGPGGFAPRLLLFHEGDDARPCDGCIGVCDIDVPVPNEIEFPADPLRTDAGSRAVPGCRNACGGGVNGSREVEGA